MRIVRTLRLAREEFFARMLADTALSVGLEPPGEDDCERYAADGPGCAQELGRAGRGAAAPPARLPLKPDQTRTAHPDDPARRARLTAIEYEPGRCYAVRIEGAFDTVSLRYEAIDAPEGVTVTFDQEVASLDAQKSGVLKAFSTAVHLNRMAQRLMSLERRPSDAPLEGFGARTPHSDQVPAPFGMRWPSARFRR